MQSRVSPAQCTLGSWIRDQRCRLEPECNHLHLWFALQGEGVLEEQCSVVGEQRLVRLQETPAEIHRSRQGTRRKSNTQIVYACQRSDCTNAGDTCNDYSSLVSQARLTTARIAFSITHAEY